MNSEWMKVMLEEIARKQDEEAQARLEIERRREEGNGCAPELPARSPAAGYRRGDSEAGT